MLKLYRKYRTAILAVIATMTLVGSAVYTFDVPWQEIGGYFFAASVLVILIMIPAAAAGGLLYWRRRSQYLKARADAERQIEDQSE